MSQAIRFPEIIELARRDGKVTVEALSDYFGVTLQTIRRDLSELAEAGRLERVHGGAVLPSGTVNIGYSERRQLNAQAKANIAAACAARISDGQSVFLSIGTTTEAVAKALAHRAQLMVVTNNVNIAQILSDAPGIEVVLTGGKLRRSDGGLTGTLAAEAIRRFRFDVAITGCSALDPSGDLLDFDIEEVAAAQALLAQSRNRVLVTDHSKLGRSAPVRIASLEDFDVVFTDAPLPDALASACDDWDTEVMVADQSRVLQD